MLGWAGLSTDVRLGVPDGTLFGVEPACSMCKVSYMLGQLVA